MEKKSHSEDLLPTLDVYMGKDRPDSEKKSLGEQVLEAVSIDNMDGFEFERFIAHLFGRLGFGKAKEIRKTVDAGRDIVIQTPGGELIIVECKHHPKGTIQAYDSAVNFWINSVDVADVDGDSLNEIVLSGYCWGYDGIYMFIAIGSNLNQNEIVWLGTYYWIVSGDSYICSIDVVDFDGDGIMEIIAVGYYYDMNSFVWRSYSAVLSWSQITGLVIENINEGDSQTYSYSVTTKS